MKKLLTNITNIYITIIFILFPLIVNENGYEKILEIKYFSFLSISFLYLLFNLLILIYFFAFEKVNIFKEYKIKRIHKIAILFLFINFVSTVLSPYKEFNLIKGIGRGEGLLNVFLYVSIFINISIFGKFEKKHLNLFSISSILVSTICLLQYIGFNPLNLYQKFSGPFNMSYMGTIGNIDFLSAYYVLMLSVSMLSYIFTDEFSKLHIISLLLGFTIFSLINVDSGKVGFLALAAVILPYSLKNNNYLSKTIFVLGIFLFGYTFVYILNMSFFYSNFKYLSVLNVNYITLLLVSTLIIVYISKKIILKNKYEIINFKKLRNNMYIIYIFAFIFVIVLLYFIPFKSGILYQIHEMLHLNFDDTFGTYRIFLWKRAITLFPDYPLIGTGPDSFAIRFMSEYYEDVIKLDGVLTINDSACNVYLTTLINIGIIGLISYICVIIFSMKSVKNNPIKMIILGAIIAYLVQDFFNISLVIITPFFWITMSLLTLEK